MRRLIAIAAAGLVIVSAWFVLSLDRPGERETLHRASALMRKTLGQSAVVRPDGLFQLGAGEDAITTHGPDPKQSVEGSTKARGFGPGAPERTPECATDHFFHFLYAYRQGAKNRIDDARILIRNQIRRTDAVLNEDSLASGGPAADYRVLCDSAGEIQIDPLAIAGPKFESVVAAAKNAGFEDDGVNYVIFADDFVYGVCGTATYDEDESAKASNQSNQGGGYAVAYRDCWQELTPMHEMGHTMGAVQPGAEHSTGSGGHCWEENDVMCYSPDGGDEHQQGTVRHCAGRSVFDCNFDDYFDSAPEPGEYLAKHWNIGSPQNSFISFGGDGTTSPAVDLDQSRSLPPGRSRASTSAAVIRYRAFTLRVPKGASSLRVEVTRECGDLCFSALSVYAAAGEKANRFRRDCAVGSREPSPQLCEVDHPKPGMWTVSVYTDRGLADDPFSIRATTR